MRWEARRRGVSVAEIVRHAVEALLDEDRAAPLSFVAIGEGGPADASERTDEIVAAAMRRRRGPAD